MVNAFTSRVPAQDSRFWRVLERWRWLPVVLLVLAVAQCSAWIMDREPPFKVVSYTAQPAKAGGVLVINAVVKRDLQRDCYVELSNSLFDADRVRWDLGTTQAVSPQGLREMDAQSPGLLIRKIALPPGMAAGRASLLSSMTYRCNPLHDLFRPISVDVRFDFEVSP